MIFQPMYAEEACNLLWYLKATGRIAKEENVLLIRACLGLQSVCVDGELFKVDIRN